MLFNETYVYYCRRATFRLLAVAYIVNCRIRHYYEGLEEF